MIFNAEHTCVCEQLKIEHNAEITDYKKDGII